MGRQNFALPNSGSKTWWTYRDLNPGPLPCRGSALPLSYRPTKFGDADWLGRCPAGSTARGPFSGEPPQPPVLGDPAGRTSPLIRLWKHEISALCFTPLVTPRSNHYHPLERLHLGAGSRTQTHLYRLEACGTIPIPYPQIVGALTQPPVYFDRRVRAGVLPLDLSGLTWWSHRDLNPDSLRARQVSCR